MSLKTWFSDLGTFRRMYRANQMSDFTRFKVFGEDPRPCAICRTKFEIGDGQVVVNPRAADKTEKTKSKQGSPYTAKAELAHDLCMSEAYELKNWTRRPSYVGRLRYLLITRF